ncbi:MAG: DUF6573 family protein [Bradyrhizobium sp.]|jgi:hypothetical protein|uniref:DUF6573 family protein n=1 Tax=Bradyrhizobium sp. TaxID=376 RepID=UPI003D0E8911
MSNQPTEHPFFGEVISVYTRAQALADGVLIDAGPMAREAGFRWPVALTTAAWEDCVAWSESDSDRQTHQDQSGRLWDVLFMAAYAARANAAAGSELRFELCRVSRDGRSTEAELTTLKLIVGPGDDGEPVMTILLPNED